MNIEVFEKKGVSPIRMYIRSTLDIPPKWEGIWTSSYMKELYEIALRPLKVLKQKGG